MYITERGVFKLSGKELVLEEVAPGIDIDKDIIAKMEFIPRMKKQVKEMDGRLFNKSKMNIREELKHF